MGRSEQLDALRRALTAARGGHPRIVLIEGEPGIGKTALVRWFLGSRSDVVTLWASGEESEVALEYGVVDQLHAAMPPPIPRPRVDTGEDSLAVGAELLASLGAVEEQGTVVVVIDDLHWADLPSSRALLFWLRRLRADPVLILLAARPYSLERLGAGWARVLNDGARCEHLRLAGLGPAEVRLLAAANGQPLPVATSERLRDHTEGNPLYLRALLDELPGEVLLDADRLLPAPHSYAATVLARTARLSPAGQQLVAAAAVLGTRSPTGLAASVAGLDRIAPALDDAVRHGLLDTATNAGRAEVVFPHPLVRAAVYDDMAPMTRRSLHRAAGHLLDQPTGLAHRVAATVGVDPELAALLAGAAATELAAGALHAAARYWVWSARLDPSPARAEERLLRAVELLLISGDVAAAQSHREEVLRCAESAPRRFLLAALTAAEGRLAEAETELRAVLDVTPLPAQADLFGRAAAALALVCTLRGDERAAMTWAARSMDVAAGAPTVAMTAKQSLAYSLANSGRASQALALLAGPSAAHPRPEPFEAELVATRGAIRSWAGDAEGAVQDVNAVIRWVRAGATTRSVPNSFAALAEVQYRQGDWDDGIVSAELAVSLASDLDHGWYLAHFHAVATSLHAARGDWTTADGHVLAAERAAAAVPNPASAAFACLAAATVAWARSDWLLVLAALAPMHEQMPPMPVNALSLASWRLRTAEALLNLGRFDEAAAALDDCRAATAEALGPSPDHVRLTALLHQSRGNLAAARATFAEGVPIVAPAHMPFGEALLRLAYGRFLRVTGSRRAALAELTASRHILLGLGARPALLACDAELHACGLHPAVPEEGSGQARLTVPLTAKERIVASLAAKGLSNREVAAELYVSAKTVEFHLGNTFTKFGITSRRQLGASLRTAESGAEG